jgi:hypothetical protein
VHVYRNAGDDIAEQAIRIQTLWHRSEQQLEVIKRAEPLLSVTHKEILDNTLCMLQRKLDIVVSKLRSLVKPVVSSEDAPAAASGNGATVQYVPRRVQYAFGKDSFKEAVDSLEYWQGQLDPSWFLILRISNQQLDTDLAQVTKGTDGALSSVWAIRAGHSNTTAAATGGTTMPPRGDQHGIFLPAGEMDNINIMAIPLCEAKLARRHGSSKRLVLSDIPSPEWGEPQNVKKDIRELALRLRHDEPRTFGILTCRGVIPRIASSSSSSSSSKDHHQQQQKLIYTMVFRVPQEITEVRSLRSVLCGAAPKSLSHRFSIARELAKSVSYVHTFGFVHKNIRPDTVLACQTAGAAAAPATFLVGFEDFRREEGISFRRGDDRWERNLYRHPSRRGVAPAQAYVMQHDIYSLGVCLLEVGLWQSFVEYGPDGLHPRPSPLLVGSSGGVSGQSSGVDLNRMKGHFVELAREKLPRVMGSRYANIVETCLTCLDTENRDFGDPSEFEDEDGIRIGVRYIEKVRISSLSHFDRRLILGSQVLLYINSIHV